MPALVVVGAQWGDEGKGKVVDLLAPHAELVVRFAGGANAGHTLVVGGEKLVLHLIPSGILHEGKRCLIAQGTVIDAPTVIEEIDALEARGVSTVGRLGIAEAAHLVLPHHKLIDGLREAAAGDSKIGTTKRGIGPAYEDKIGRRGIRVGDLWREGLSTRLEANLEAWRPVVEALGDGAKLPRVAELLAQMDQWSARLRPIACDAALETAQALAADQKVLLEGAQGTMLDVDHGTYPFVTSSSAVAGGACTGAGVGPTSIDVVMGITKAYTTRVGGGPFPTELDDAMGERLRTAGAEFGATTGRPRRCGWLDLPALRMAARVNGLTSIALTKLDVLTGLSELRLCTGYRWRDRVHAEPPFDAWEEVEPEYETLPGWTEDITGCRERGALPAAARNYIGRIEELAECPVSIISVGPDREQTIGDSDPFAP